MQKGLVFDIKRFAVHDGKGVRSTVFLKGCPLHCAWCHNPEGMINKRRIWQVQNRCIGCGACLQACTQQALYRESGKIYFSPAHCISDGACARICTTGALKWDSTEMTVEDVMEVVRRDHIVYEKSGGGITLSGGEPTGEQAEFALAILKQCKEEGYHTTIESCMFTSRDVVRRFEEVVDDFIVDIKIFDGERHRKATGVDNARILENIKELSEKHFLLIRTPMIPGYTNDLENVRAIGDFVKKLPNVRMELLNFNPLFTQKYQYRGEHPECPMAERLSEEEMELRRNILREKGIVVIQS